MFIILYRLRNYEVVTKITHDGNHDYIAKTFNIGVPVSDKNQDELDEFDDKAVQYLDLWKELVNKNNECVCEAYISGSTSEIVPYGISPKDIYWNCYANKYSRSWIKNYLKYKKCVKNHRESIIYFTEHVEDSFYTSSMTEKEIAELKKGRDELVALCHMGCCNCTFIMSEINKGLWCALKKDLKRIINGF